MSVILHLNMKYRLLTFHHSICAAIQNLKMNKDTHKGRHLILYLVTHQDFLRWGFMHSFAFRVNVLTLEYSDINETLDNVFDRDITSDLFV